MKKNNAHILRKITSRTDIDIIYTCNIVIKLFYIRQNNIISISALDQFYNARVFCTVMHYIIFYTAEKKKKKYPKSPISKRISECL